jgi:preprotein translocase subunit SecG
MITLITMIHIAAIVLLVISVLLQSGKGAEISASFGGSSQTVFGSSGGQNFFQKLTYALAGIFMVTSLTLTILPSRLKKSVLEGYTAPPATSQPATAQPAAPAAEQSAAPATGETQKK